MIPQCVYKQPKQSSSTRLLIRRLRRSCDDVQRASSNLSSSSGLALGNTAASTSAIAGSASTAATSSSQSIPLAQQYQNYNHQRLMSMRSKAFAEISSIEQLQQQYSNYIPSRQTYTKYDSPWAITGYAMGAAAIAATVGFLMDESKKESSQVLASSSYEDKQQHVESTNITKPEPTPTNYDEGQTLLATVDAAAAAAAASLNDDEVDPYENLPEEDEPTDCSMCRTFRQGPCRPYWRKLERCFKDHENEENGATKCMKYFTPHQRCLVNYSNLYQLISLDQKQELVTDFEKSVTMEERRCWGCIKGSSGPQAIEMDWGKWPEFINEVGFGFSQLITPSNHDEDEVKEEFKTSPLWKRFPLDTEPVLITGTAHIPQTTELESADESSSDTPREDLILKVSWATDQDGMVLGLSYNQYYGKLLEKSSSKSKDEATTVDKDDDSTKSDEENDNTATKNQLEFFIIPSSTQHVTIHALYAENPLNVPQTKEILDVLLYESRPYSMKKAIYEISPVQSEQVKTDSSANVPIAIERNEHHVVSNEAGEGHNTRQIVAATSSSDSQVEGTSGEEISA